MMIPATNPNSKPYVIETRFILSNSRNSSRFLFEIKFKRMYAGIGKTRSVIQPRT